MIRVQLPAHLQTLARVPCEVAVDVTGQATAILIVLMFGAIEARFPQLRGTIRDRVTDKRRPFVRFFACEEDWSHASPDDPLPEAVVDGREPFLVVGAMAGG